MPCLVPGIHVFLWCGGEDVDGRAKPGHDGGGVRVSKDEDEPVQPPSCFETPRCARLLSMRAGEGSAGRPDVLCERRTNLWV
jgi:hypothetical protein